MSTSSTAVFHQDRLGCILVSGSNHYFTRPAESGSRMSTKTAGTGFIVDPLSLYGDYPDTDVGRLPEIDRRQDDDVSTRRGVFGDMGLVDAARRTSAS